MGMRDAYAYAIQTAKGKFHGNAEERDGKLYFKGTVATEAEKNELWTAIKTIPTWQNDIVAVNEADVFARRELDDTAHRGHVHAGVVLAAQPPVDLRQQRLGTLDLGYLENNLEAVRAADRNALRLTLTGRGSTPQQAELRWGLGTAHLQQAMLYLSRALRQQQARAN